jgi:hypothetical protein
VSVHAEPAHLNGVMAEIGWGDTEESGRAARGTGFALLLIVTSAYWGSTWLLSGLAPLAFVASNLRRRRRHASTERGQFAA